MFEIKQHINFQLRSRNSTISVIFGSQNEFDDDLGEMFYEKKLIEEKIITGGETRR